MTEIFDIMKLVGALHPAQIAVRSSGDSDPTGNQPVHKWQTFEFAIESSAGAMREDGHGDLVEPSTPEKSTPVISGDEAPDIGWVMPAQTPVIAPRMNMRSTHFVDEKADIEAPVTKTSPPQDVGFVGMKPAGFVEEATGGNSDRNTPLMAHSPPIKDSVSLGHIADPTGIWRMAENPTGPAKPNPQFDGAQVDFKANQQAITALDVKPSESVAPIAQKTNAVNSAPLDNQPDQRGAERQQLSNDNTQSVTTPQLKDNRPDARVQKEPFPQNVASPQTANAPVGESGRQLAPVHPRGNEAPAIHPAQTQGEYRPNTGRPTHHTPLTGSDAAVRSGWTLPAETNPQLPPDLGGAMAQKPTAPEPSTLSKAMLVQAENPSTIVERAPAQSRQNPEIVTTVPPRDQGDASQPSPDQRQQPMIASQPAKIDQPVREGRAQQTTANTAFDHSHAMQTYPAPDVSKVMTASDIKLPTDMAIVLDTRQADPIAAEVQLGREGALSASSKMPSPTPVTVLETPVARQIAAAVVHQEGAMIEVTLSPEELGRVRLQMTSQDGTMMVSLSADRAETSDLMRRHLDDLAKEFLDLGFSDIGFSFDDRAADSPEQESEHTESDTETDSMPTEPAPQKPTLPSDGAVDLRL